MRTSEEWIDDTIQQHSEVFGLVEYDQNYYVHINQFANAIANGKYSNIQFISSSNQSSFTSVHDNTCVIFFDVSQSQFLKNVIRQILLHEDFVSLADTFKRAGCLYILNRDYNFSSLAFRYPIIQFVNYHLIDNDKIATYREYLQPLRQMMRLPEFSEALDNFIVGHEIAHLLKRNGHFPATNKTYYNEIFNRTITKCCYENEPSFKEIATYHGEFDIDVVGLKRIRRDPIIRRMHYLNHQDHLLEEMECDSFSFHMLLDYYFDKDIKSIDRHTEFSFMFFAIFSIFNIHFAMNQRFLLSERSGIDELKPGGIADMNFRKVALQKNMIAYILKRFDFLNQKGEKAFLQAYEDYRQESFTIKKSIDGLYMMPVTRAIHELLKNVQTMKDQIPSKEPLQYNIQSLLERIIRSEGMFHQEELAKIFKQENL